MQHRLRALALVGIVVLWAAGSQAAEQPRRSRTTGAREPMVEDEAETGELGEDAEPGEDELDGSGALPSEPALRAPSLRPAPRGEDEEPPPPPATGPAGAGPAEPASAAQPLSPE